MPDYKSIKNGKTKLYKINTMLKKVSLLLSLVAVFMLSSCNSKMKEMAQDNFTVTPGVLEVVGSEIPVSIDGKFPAKYFNKKSVMTVTPVLKYEGGEAVAESSTFQGEKVLGNDERADELFNTARIKFGRYEEALKTYYDQFNIFGAYKVANRIKKPDTK